jgi:hypothetical protein
MAPSVPEINDATVNAIDVFEAVPAHMQFNLNEIPVDTLDAMIAAEEEAEEEDDVFAFQQSLANIFNAEQALSDFAGLPEDYANFRMVMAHGYSWAPAPDRGMVRRFNFPRPIEHNGNMFDRDGLFNHDWAPVINGEGRILHNRLMGTLWANYQVMEFWIVVESGHAYEWTRFEVDVDGETLDTYLFFNDVAYYTRDLFEWTFPGIVRGNLGN